jgi:hypothetical protein
MEETALTVCFQVRNLALTVVRRARQGKKIKDSHLDSEPKNKQGTTQHN